MDYRLIETHPLIGIRGQVFNKEEYKSVEHFNRPLLEPLTEDYQLTYNFETRSKNRIARYMYDSLFDLESFLSHLKDVDAWVLMGLLTAAQEKRGYKYMGDKINITLSINE